MEEAAQWRDVLVAHIDYCGANQTAIGSYDSGSYVGDVPAEMKGSLVL